MIDIASEHLITLQEAADRLPASRGGKPVHWSTIWRWIKDRKIEGVRIGARWVTSIEALQRHAERETLAALGAHAMTPVQTRTRQRAIQRADREAEAIGI
jgi:hypothetical protein